MKKQDLDALRELYSSVYGGEFLLERRQALPGQSQIEIDRQEAERERQAQATNRALQSGRTIDARLSSGLGATLTGQRGRVALNKKGELEVKDANPNFQLDKTIQFGGKGYNRKTGPDGKVTYVPASNPLRPAAPPRTPAGSPPPRTPAGSPPPRTPAGSPPPAAKPSGVVLARKNNVTGTLDKSTGKFTEKNWNDAETQRYQARAAQNAARTSASSGGSPSSSSSSSTSAASAPKPPTPAIGKLGNTSFERRTPTSAELRAAQAERATQKASGQDTSSVKNAEKALQAAQKTNLPTTGPSPAIPDLKSVNADLAKANSPAVINRPAPAGTALAAQQAQQKKPMQKQSYEWPSAKTIKDIADAYASIYEAKKKVDQDQDGDNDFADVRIARMVASGVPKEVAIAKVKGKSYNEEVEIDEATAMAKRGYDETKLRQRAGGGEAADRATALEKKPTYGNKNKEAQRSRYARAQRGDFRNTASSNPGLHGYGFRSNDPKVKAKQAARGAQRGALTPKEKKELNIEAYEVYEIVASYLLENNFAETLNDANVIIENMSENWLEEILIEKSGEQPLPYGRMMKKSDELSDSDDREKQKRAATIYLAANAPKGPKVKKRN